MKGFKKGWYTLDNMVFKLTRLVIFAATTAMIGVATAQVLMRYFLSLPLRWGNEFCCFMLVYDVFLGAALALRTGEHVRLDLSNTALPNMLLKVLDRISILAVYVFIAIYFYFGIQFAASNGNSVTEVMKWPYYSLYCILPVSAVLMLIGQTTSLLKRTDKEVTT